MDTIETNLAIADDYQAPTDGPPAGAFDIAAIEAEHARWLESGGKEGKRANFRGMELARIDISGRHLAEASLRGANLTGANLSQADLRAADLVESILDSANFSGAQLAGASLARAQMHHMNASGADLTGANLIAAVGEGANFTLAKLGNAILRDVNFRQADFTQAQMHGAQMRGASITGSNMSNADLSGADCRDSVFDHTRFYSAQLNETSFKGALLSGVDLHAADFSKANDIGAEFQTQSLQSERGKLQEEQMQLAQLRRDIEARETQLAAEKARTEEKAAALAAMEEQAGAIALRLGRFAVGFLARFVVWMALGGALLACTVFFALRIEHPDMARLSALIATDCLLLLLAGFSMVRSLQIARLAKQLAKTYEGSPESANGQVPAANLPDLCPKSAPRLRLRFGKAA